MLAVTCQPVGNIDKLLGVCKVWIVRCGGGIIRRSIVADAADYIFSSCAERMASDCSKFNVNFNGCIDSAGYYAEYLDQFGGGNFILRSSSVA